MDKLRISKTPVNGKSSIQLQFEQRLAAMNVVFPVESFNVNKEGIYIDDQIALLYDVYTEGLNEPTRIFADDTLNTLPPGVQIDRHPTLDYATPCIITPVGAKLTENVNPRTEHSAPTYRVPLIDKMETRNVVTHQMAYGVRKGVERMLVAGGGICLVNDGDIVYAVTLFENYDRLYQEFVIKEGHKVETYSTRDFNDARKRVSKLDAAVRNWLGHSPIAKLPPRFHNPPIVPTLL